MCPSRCYSTTCVVCLSLHFLSTTSEREEVCRVFVLRVCCVRRGAEGSGRQGLLGERPARLAASSCLRRRALATVARLPPTERRAIGEREGGRAPVARRRARGESKEESKRGEPARAPVPSPCHGGCQSRVPKVAGAKAGGFKAAGAPRPSLLCGRSSPFSLVPLVASLLCCRLQLLVLRSLCVAPVAASQRVRCCSLSGVSCCLFLSLSLAPLPLPLTCSTYTHRVTSMNSGLIHLDHKSSFM